MYYITYFPQYPKFSLYLLQQMWQLNSGNFKQIVASSGRFSGIHIKFSHTFYQTAKSLIIA